MDDLVLSVAYPGCLFLILIFVRPGFRVSDPGSNNSTKRGGGKIVCRTIFCSPKYNKL
jgi:hypothetical protein